MITISQIQIEIQEINDRFNKQIPEILQKKAAKVLGVAYSDIKSLAILKRSIDARKKPNIFYSFSVAVDVKNEDRVLKKARSNNIQKYLEKEYKIEKSNIDFINNPVVVGFGPAGIAAALTLARAGAKPIVIERGSEVSKRTKLVEEFWKTGKLNPNTNVQFGEGGAGAFSDGKLNTGNKDKDGLKRAVLKTLVEHGAPERILYDAKPHIGTDILTNVVKSIRNEIISLGGEVRFETKLVDIVVKDKRLSKIIVENDDGRGEIITGHLLLAIGHSSRDTFKMLLKNRFVLEPKPFAVGYRVAHLQSDIDFSQYGEGYNDKNLPAADYKLTYTAASGRPIYSFCMCPGGYIVNASSADASICVNGMSYSKRDAKYANSAIVMGITPDEIPGDDCLKGMYFQQEIEKKAYEIGNGRVPVCYFGSSNGDEDFKSAIMGKTVFIPNMVKDNLILTDKLNEDFVEGMNYFGRKIRKFNDGSTIIAGIETRTSSPVRIVRDDKYTAFDKNGIYPIGEGAGFAGGIMSAAMDGVRAVKSIIN